MTVERIEDDQFWLDVRKAIWTNIDALGRQQVAMIVVPHLTSRTVTHGAKMTIWWMRNIVSERLAA